MADSARSRLLDWVDEQVLVLDGATGTGLQAMALSDADFDGLEGCNEVLNLSRPDAIEALHAGYLEAGAGAVLTNTFGGTTITLDEYGLGARAREINAASARIARRTADRFSTPARPRFAIGSLGPGTKLPTLGQIGFDQLHAGYLEQARGLVEGGVDALLVETVYDLLQGKAAIIACKDACREAGVRLPIFCTVTIETTGQMLVGSEIGAALTALAPFDLDGIGLNCATGPDFMHEPLRYLSRHAPARLLCSPNAGLPRVENDETIYDLSPEGLADAQRTFISEYGARIVGGCCGTTDEHVRALVEAVAGLEPARREPSLPAAAASLFSSTTYEQDASFLIVGERANANGSRRFKRLLEAGEWEQMANVIRDQAAEGAHVADVCVDFVGRDGVPDMQELVGRARGLSTLPLMLDSTEPEVLEAGLKLIGGKPIVNSINFEDGGERLSRTLGAARRYGAAVVALSIDEQGQARTADRKVEIAERLYRTAIDEYGLPPQDIFFDALTMPLGSGQEDLRCDGLETLNAVEEISRRFPDSQTILGVSNISFGLNAAARQVLNSVFLAEAVERGLTAAIVHAAQILPEHQIDPAHLQAARRLIHDEWVGGEDPLTAFMALFEGATVRREEADLTELAVEERLHRRIVDGLREGLHDDLAEALAGRAAIAVINELLLPAMQEVGDLFGAGKMQLPFVLQSAETMKSSVAYLEPHMEKADAAGKGRIVLATVRGDVHDIGKNLVDIILSNNGFTTINLGIKQPIASIIEAAEEHEADAIGLSPAGQVDAGDEGGLAGVEPPRDRRPLADPARRRRPHPPLRRMGPPQRVPRQGLLRQGRLRRPAHHELPSPRRTLGRRPRSDRPRSRSRERHRGTRSRGTAETIARARRRCTVPAVLGRSPDPQPATARYLPLHQRDRPLPRSMGLPQRQRHRGRNDGRGARGPAAVAIRSRLARHPHPRRRVRILPRRRRRR